MASLLLSEGVPMISGGDELGRTQQGNNNAYCQDNELSWTTWDLTLEQQQFLAFTRRLVALPPRAAGAARGASTSRAERSAAPRRRTSTGSTRAAAR